MGAVPGLGVTHVPLLAGRDENMARILRRVLQDPALPAALRAPDGWPDPMRREWGARSACSPTTRSSTGRGRTRAGRKRGSSRPLHHPLGHAFMNTLLFLDYDRRGFPYPGVAFQVNCYGRRVIAQRGGLAGLPP